MKNLIAIMGKSGSGKDTIFKEILKQDHTLTPIILYTTRPRRPGEQEGIAYHFVTDEEFNHLDKNKTFLAKTKYNTVKGIWKYGIPNVNSEGTKIIVATPEEIIQMKQNISKETIFHLFYISCDEEMRIIKQFMREKKKKDEADYEEILRRVVTDKEDFSKDNKYMKELLTDCNIIYNDYITSPADIAAEFLYSFSHRWKDN